jgi:hypothetical protein
MAKLKKRKPVAAKEYCSIRLNMEDEEKLIIEVEKESDKGIGIRLDSDIHEFSFIVSKKVLRKLAVAIMRYLKTGEQGCFYYDEFLIGHGNDQKEFPAQEIIDQYPF